MYKIALNYIEIGCIRSCIEEACYEFRIDFNQEFGMSASDVKNKVDNLRSYLFSINPNNSVLEIDFDNDIIHLVLKSIFITLRELDSDLQTRTGYFRDEIEAIQNRIEKLIR